jgi:hypothetical protein
LTNPAEYVSVVLVNVFAPGNSPMPHNSAPASLSPALARAAAETTDPLISAWLARLAEAKGATAPAQAAGRRQRPRRRAVARRS